VTDTDASLRLLADTLPVTVQGLTRYWVTVEPLS
jgi:transmembrane sensor